MRTYLAEAALLPQGWAENVLIEVGPSGTIAGVTPDASAARGRANPTASSFPGMIDLHSHAFQRALAGLTQRLGADAASFWTWRDVMYAFAAKITPEDQRAIAAQLYLELLKGGYCSVVEFHYLHHQPDGAPYDEPATMSLAIHEAAGEAGIALTLLPVVYMQAGWMAARLRARSDGSRSTRTAGRGSRNRLDRSFADDPDRQLGLAVHSVRAVPPAGDHRRGGGDAWRDPVPCRSISTSPSSPRRSTTAWSASAGGHGSCSRDVAEVDHSWCLVHGTHLTEDGDRRGGRTPGRDRTVPEHGGRSRRRHLPAGTPSSRRDGQYGIGSDSNMTTDAAAELRLLEQGQRLAQLRRVTAVERGYAALRRGAVACRTAEGVRGPRVDRSAGSRPVSAPISSCSTPIIRAWSAASGDLRARRAPVCARVRPSATSWSAGLARARRAASRRRQAIDRDYAAHDRAPAG